MVGTRKEEGQTMMPITNIPNNSERPFILKMNLFFQVPRLITTNQRIIEFFFIFWK
jgi:hypothetical protein